MTRFRFADVPQLAVSLGVLLLTSMGLTATVHAAGGSAGRMDIPGGPLEVRNVAPIVGLYGTPRFMGARVADRLGFSVNLEVANNFQSENIDGTFVFLDGETYISSFHIGGGLSERWDWELEVPHRTCGRVAGWLGRRVP